MCITFQGSECVFFLKELSDSLYDFWTLHSPHIGGLIWLMDQVTLNLPDFRGPAVGLACGVSSLCSRPVRTQTADQRHQPSGYNRHSEVSLEQQRSTPGNLVWMLQQDMAALPWRDCGAWAALVRRKEEAVGGCPSDAVISVYKTRTQCLWPRCSWSLSWGSKAISTRAHPGVSPAWCQLILLGTVAAPATVRSWVSM